MIDLKIVCEDPKYMPAYANSTDACMDLKVKLGCDPKLGLQLSPGKSIVLGTGIKVAIPEGHVMLIFPRSSTGIKLNLMLSNTTGVIDAGYRDEIRMAVTNFGNKSVIIEDGQKLAQFMVIPRPSINLIQVEDDDNFRNGDRGGGLGSTGKF